MRIAKQLTLPTLLLALLLLLVSCDTMQTTPSTNETTADSNVTVDATETTQTESETHEHTYSAATCTIPGTCACGETYGTALGHDLTDATCTEPAVCKRCGVAEGSALGHDYHSATCTKPMTCSRCNLEKGEVLEHDFKEATCTTAEICKLCELTRGEPLGHEYEAASCTKPEYCRVCGYEHGEAMGHIYADNLCVRCNEVDPESILSTAHVMDAKKYEFGTAKDSFGQSYANAHVYSSPYVHEAAFSIHALPKQFATLEGTIVVVDGTPSNKNFKINIFVDDKLVYTLENYKSTSGGVDFALNVKGGATLKIEIWESDNKYYKGGIAIVGAEFSK